MNLAHMSKASSNTIRNRRKKLIDRMKRIVDNSSIQQGSEKVFIKQCMKSIIDEIELIVRVERNKHEI